MLNAFNASTTAHDSTTFNVSNQEPYLLETGAGAEEVTINTLGTYQIDIFGDVKNFNPKAFPLLTITANLGSQGINAPMITWIDEYEGDAHVDVKLDDLRESTKHTLSGVYAGRLSWAALTTPASDGVDAVIGSTAVETALADSVGKSTGKLLALAFNTSADNIVGSKTEVIRKLANTLAAYSYTNAQIVGASKTYQQYVYESGTSVMAFWCFEDFAIKCNATYYQKHEIIVGIKEFVFNEDMTEFYVILDFGQSNFDSLYATTASNTVLLQEVADGTGTAFDTSNDEYYTRMSRLLMIGYIVDVPSPIAEGENYDEGTNFIFGQEQKVAHTQIFKSKKYGITGTRLATKVRFHDDFAITRRRKLNEYKGRISAAMIYGKGGVSYHPVTGYRIGSMPGILDYELFPIRYIKSAIPTIATGTVNGSTFQDWIDDMTYALNAYKQNGSDANTVLVSRDVINSISRWSSFIASTSSNVLGGYSGAQTPPSGSMTLGLDVTELKGRYGTLRLIHEPALDYMPLIKAASTANRTAGVPEFMFPDGVNPRKVMISIDKAFIDFCTLRPDKITGNLQDNGQDIFQEGIMGEHTLKMRFPKNHAVIVLS